MQTASVTTWTIVSARWTPVGSATDPARFTTAVVRTSRPVTVIVMATKLTPWASVVDHVLRTRMQTAFCDDVDDCVGSLDACGVCNGPGEIYDCGCADIPAGDCTAAETRWTHWGSAAAIARPMKTATAFATSMKVPAVRGIRRPATSTPSRSPWMWDRSRIIVF